MGQARFSRVDFQNNYRWTQQSRVTQPAQRRPTAYCDVIARQSKPRWHGSFLQRPAACIAAVDRQKAAKISLFRPGHRRCQLNRVCPLSPQEFKVRRIPNECRLRRRTRRLETPLAPAFSGIGVRNISKNVNRSAP